MESHDKGGVQVTFLTPVWRERQSEGLLAASGQRRTAILGSIEGCTIRERVKRRPESFLELESCLEIHIETQVAGTKPGVLFPLVRKFPGVLSSRGSSKPGMNIESCGAEREDLSVGW